MLPLLALGAAIGVMWGALKHSRSASDSQVAEEKQLNAEQQQSSPQLPPPLQDIPVQQNARHSHRFSNAKVAAAAVGGFACLAAAAAVSILIGKRRRHGRSKQHGSR